MSSCSDLVAFADGELEPDRAEAFRVHLQTCERCQTELIPAIQLSTHLAVLVPAPDRMAPASECPAPRAKAVTVEIGPDGSRSRRGCVHALLVWALGALRPAALALLGLADVSRPSWQRPGCARWRRGETAASRGASAGRSGWSTALR